MVRSTNLNINEEVKAGLASLERGDGKAARASFERLVASGVADASVFLGLAYAYRLLKDSTSALAAVDRALALAPADVRAMIFKADTFLEMGNTRGAAAFYNQAVRAAEAGAQLAPDLAAEVNRARDMCARFANQLEDNLLQMLSSNGIDAAASPRFQQSLEILFGRKQRFAQDPRYYFFPELPQRQFFSRDEFPWLNALEKSTEAIRGELREVMKQPSVFKPYVQGDASRPHNAQNGMLNNPDWSAFYLYKDGDLVAENAARCPQTMAAIANVPLADVQYRSPSVLFSLLRPGAHIPPHCGLINTRLIGHLPLIVPPGCTFRVGNESRSWAEGRAWLFDDTIEHEAWNRSAETRVILIFEVWRPEITIDERHMLRTMFAAIDAYAGKRPQWEI
jgi:aspartate beta-hydroxylase